MSRQSLPGPLISRQGLPGPLISRQGIPGPLVDFNAPVEGIAGVPYESIYLAIGKQ